MIAIIYPYRNRDLQRIQNSLDSLNVQTDSNFKVFFVDYGSNGEMAKKTKQLVSKYPFANYQFHPTENQPWNKSKALNSVIKNLKEAYCFVADVDIIFQPKFIEKATKLQDTGKAIYFKVGFLNSRDSTKNDEFQSFKNYRISTKEVTGLTLFPVDILKKLRGFDEFYHFWGAEDTDIHVRIKNAGNDVEFYDKEILMLHQWHPSYLSKEKNDIDENLQIKGIIQLNDQHLKNAVRYMTTVVNPNSWGECMTQEEIRELNKPNLSIVINNEQREIKDFLFGQLPVMKNKIIKINISEDPFQHSVRYKIKRIIGKKVPQYYSLKEINDIFLLHLISFYRENPYFFKICPDKKEIELTLKL